MVRLLRRLFARSQSETPRRARPSKGQANKRRLGVRGERIAARLLRGRGLTGVGRNVLSGSGEIDLVAVQGDVVVFVEVKSRTFREGVERNGFENLARRKCAALRRACGAYLRRIGRPVGGYRLDVVTVEFVHCGWRWRPREVRWFPGALDL